MRLTLLPGPPALLVADSTAHLGARMAIFGFGFFVALSLIDRLPRLTDRTPGPYVRGKLRATKVFVPVSLGLGVVGLAMWVFAR